MIDDDKFISLFMIMTIIAIMKMILMMIKPY